MGKRSKQPSAPSSADNALEPSSTDSNSVFDKLFGDVPRGKDSIFTDDNPFRRRKVESLPSEQPIQSEPIPQVPKQRNDDEISSEKMLKREKVVEEDIDRDGEGEGERKIKKKRKRDELEKEYEKRVYGEAVVEDGEKAVKEKKRKRKDGPDAMVVEKEEGFDDESKLVRTVFVGNLPLKVKKKSLLKEFSQFGEVESVRIRSVPIKDSKTPRKGAIMKKQINDAVESVNAYIVFKTEESAQASLHHNMAVVGGNHIRVDRACPPRKKLKGESTAIYDTKRTVFVGNLPFDVQDEEVYRLFCGIKQFESAVEAVRVIRDPNTSVGKGIAYVLFKTRDAAISVIKKRNLKLRDRELRLSVAKADSTSSSKRKNPVSPSSDETPTKKFANNSSGAPSSSYSGVKASGTLSYQGLRASKSGSQKKSNLKRPATVISQPNTLSTEKNVKIRTTKRPAVAARKAKALKSSSSASKQDSKKRKPESSSSSSFRKHKKVRNS